MFHPTYLRLVTLFLLPFPCLVSAQGSAPATPPPPAFLSWAATPPMGWNSYDAFGSSVTEEEFLANAQVVKDQLLSHGWNYVVVDFRWSDATAADYDPNGKPGLHLAADEFGRLLPAPERFPSAAHGVGFKPLADKIHALGLKFGIHVMRGIPRQSVTADTPIEGSKFTAKQAADTDRRCSWCRDMWGVKGDTEAGRAYYDSILRLYASWGVDFVKIDDLVDIDKKAAAPYHQAEVEAIRAAIDKTGRPIVFSTSPGQMPFSAADHVQAHANMWRISSDFWDNWRSLNHNFDLFTLWQPIAAPGHWPDGDMIPFGRIGLRCVGGDRQTKFTPEEQTTLISLWSLESSPLMLGADLRSLDPATLALLTNDRVLAIDQDPLGHAAKRFSQKNGLEVWVKDLQDGSHAVGLFNRTSSEAKISIDSQTLGLPAAAWQDLWEKSTAGTLSTPVTATLPKHGCLLLHVDAASAAAG